MTGIGVNQFMTRGVPTVAPEIDLRDAMRRLRSAPGGLLAVCDRGRLVGTLTDRDLSNRRNAQGWPGQRVADVLAPDLSYCFEDTDIEEAERLMRDGDLDRIVVLDRGGRVAGILLLANVPHRPVV